MPIVHRWVLNWVPSILMGSHLTLIPIFCLLRICANGHSHHLLCQTIVYRFDEEMNLLKSSSLNSPAFMSGSYLEKPSLFNKVMESAKEWDSGNELPNNPVKRLTTMERTLFQLREESGQDNYNNDDGFEESEESSIESAMKTKDVLVNMKSNDYDGDQVIVFIRHGRTPHNLLALFTGWADPPLADEGITDARNAGRLLKNHGFHFDVVYTR